MTAKIVDRAQIKGTDALISDFWGWAYSDLLSNRNRGIFAEFLVGHALGLTDGFRIEWDKADFNYHGKFIEVKSGAYIQAWEQKQLSKIIFNIPKARAWDYKTGEMSPDSKRNSDCYVFCVYTEMDKKDYDILNIRHWEFYVLSTSFLNANFSEQKTTSLSRIKRSCLPVAYRNLKGEVNHLFKIKSD